MIQLFRRFFQSKIGIATTLAFLAVIAVAFAASDAANTMLGGSITGGDRVVNVGDDQITSAQVRDYANSTVTQMRQENPTITMEEFVAEGMLDELLEQMIGRWSLVQFAEDFGLRVSQPTVNSELQATGLFSGLDGSFDPEVFRNFLRQQRLSEDQVLRDIRMGLYAQQFRLPLTHGANLPDSLIRRYAELSAEDRSGNVLTLSAADFAPTADPTAQQLQTYYQANRAGYFRPERRVVRYATFGAEALRSLPAITSQQVAERYQADAASYAASEERSFTRLVVPTEAAAQAVVNEVNGGMSLEASASAKGLQVVAIPAVDRAGLEEQTSAAVANAGFAAAQGGLSTPQRGELGWYVLRVDTVNRIAGQSLAQATPAIRAQLEAEQRQQALSALSETIDGDFQDRRSLRDVAQELGIELTTTRPLTASGQVFGTQETADPSVARILSFAFQLEEGQGTLFELVPGEQFIMFDVAEITRSAAAPLDQIRDEVIADWRNEQGMAAAGAAAARIVERIEGGATLAAAIAEEDVSIPSPEAISLNRYQAQAQGQLALPAILFLSMAEGTAKSLRIEEAQAWLVMQLDEIAPQDLSEGEQSEQYLALARDNFATAAGTEYTEQFLAAVRAGLDIEINETALQAVKNALLGITQ